MTHVSALWLPILLSAAFIFIASSIIHTVMPWHKGDFDFIPNEDAVRNAVGPLSIPPGDYLTPKCRTMQEMGSPEFKAKMERGPVMLMTVMPNGITPMGPIFVKWFIYLLLVSFAVACIAASVYAPGTGTRHIWHLTGVVSALCYGMALPQASIWYHRKWSTTLKGLFDSAIYGVITALTFGWLWPQM